MGGTRRTSDLGRPVDLGPAWTATDEDLVRALHPAYEPGLRRFPGGTVGWRGLPFQLGPAGGGARWLLLDREVEVVVPDGEAAEWLVVAHFCDSRRGPDGERPAGLPVGWVDGVGEPLARYVVEGAAGTADIVVRRRFEIGDGMTGWGYLPFRALGHRANEPLDPLGPHPRQEPGRYAPAGHAGPLTTLPGSWGGDQTGVTDVLPMADGSLTCWLHAIPLAATGGVRRLRLLPEGAGTPGSAVVVAGLTLFHGAADPLAVGPRLELRVTGGLDAPVEVDLGVAIRARGPARRPGEVEAAGTPAGWGGPLRAGDGAFGGRWDDPAAPPVRLVDVAATPDARVWFGPTGMRVADLAGATIAGELTVVPLAPRSVRASVRVTADGEPVPARVRFVADDGRYLPPVAHRDTVNPGLYEDNGADLILGGDVYAYVPGEFAIDLPPGPVHVEVVRGFDRAPLRRRLDVAADQRRPIELALDDAISLDGGPWAASDSHVHFLAPSTALLQAAAEGIDVVHLLATQWGDEFTNITDLPWGGMSSPDGRRHVVVGTENRENLLGHLALLGARPAVLPPASGGPPEGPLGGPVTTLLSEWAERCRAAGGLAIGAHLPIPHAEIAAAIVAGLIDGVEMQVFAPGLDTPPILEWYRFLNTGHRVPILGGTDKMTSEVPVGAIRTIARIDPASGRPLPDAWADAVRAGRTVATSGPLLWLEVDGGQPGDTLTLPAGGGRLPVRVRARAAQAVIGAVEVVVNGRVEAAREAAGSPVRELDLEDTIEVRGGAWVAARARSPFEVGSAFLTSMAAHTSPVYVDVPGRPVWVPEDAAVIATVIEGTAAWLDGLAAVPDPARRAAMRDRVLGALATLRGRAPA